MHATTDKQTVNDPLLQPLKLGHLTLKNRIMSTSHASGMDDNGMPAERYQRYHEEKAKGGLALTMFGGSSNVAPDSPSVFDQLRVDSDDVIAHMQQFSDRIHQHGAALMCQITHLGRRGDATVEHWLPTIAPSSLRETLHRSIPREMDKHDINRVVKAFGQAARRCYEGGIDGLETHAGSHLIGQFFSPDTNRRTDKYGGSLENRMRFALMVHEEIRKQTGDNFLLGIRMSMEEERGHQVTLMEAASKLGGQLLLATKAGWRRDIISVVDWRISELEHLGATLLLNQYAEEADVLSLQPDVTIIATGGLPNFGDLEGQQHCSSVWDILSGEVQPAQQVLIYDGTGRHEAVSCAQYVAAKGASTLFATIDDRVAAELGYAERSVHRKELYKLGVEVKTDLMLKEVRAQGNKLEALLTNDLTDEPTTILTDQVIVERGTTPMDELYQTLKGNARNNGVTDIDALLGNTTQPQITDNGYELYRIGDAVSSRSLHAALLDAYRLCVTL